MSRTIAALLLSFSLCSSAFAQTSAPAPKTLRLVLPQGSGVIVAPSSGDWHPTGLTLYDGGTRPVLQFKGEKPGDTLSYILFPFPKPNLTAEDCREDVIKPLLNHFSDLIDSHSIKRDSRTPGNDARQATASYVMSAASAEIESAAGVTVRSVNTFAFAAGDGVCAEVHFSRMIPRKQATPDDFVYPPLNFDPAVMPTFSDYLALASIEYKALKEYPSAAVYYARALAVLPESANPQERTIHRVLTDQLAMSYGLSGDLKHSREVNLAAIARDPDYPLYYYNLACADAEEGKADPARTHLEQAFARKANTIPGETLPDPRKDDSILKLKKNKAFWAFVETLPAN